jgi:hypothetical protein
MCSTGIRKLLAGEGHWRELAVLVLVPVVVALIWSASGIRRRLRAYAEENAGQTSVLPVADVRLAGSTDQPPRRSNRNAP